VQNIEGKMSKSPVFPQIIRTKILKKAAGSESEQIGERRSWRNLTPFCFTSGHSRGQTFLARGRGERSRGG
jgi:hypothetical protein